MSAAEKIAEYHDAVLAAKLCANMLAMHDITGMLAAIEHADSVGPMLDPTLWRNKNKAMQEDAELLRAALKLQKFGTVKP